MIKNYFSDITELFLKVKSDEIIPVDSEAKDRIKSMLQSKIAAMKTPEDIEAETAPSFWTTWRYQLFGIPASIFTIMLVAFAVSNLKVSIPKEDFSPTVTSGNQIVAEEEKPTEKDRPIVKTAPKLLVIDYGERSLNPINLPNSRTDLPTDLDVQIETPIVTVTEKTAESQALDKTSGTQDAATNIENETEDEEDEEDEKEETRKISEPATITNLQTTDLDAEISAEDINEEISETVVDTLVETTSEIVAQEAPVQEVEIAEKIPAITSKLSVPIYTYKDEELKSNDAFSQEKLLKLTSSGTPESVTVYYVDKNKVVVEIEENGVTKWYLFDNIKGTWTISRYEKYDTKAVVK